MCSLQGNIDLAVLCHPPRSQLGKNSVMDSSPETIWTLFLWIRTKHNTGSPAGESFVSFTRCENCKSYWNKILPAHSPLDLIGQKQVGVEP